MILLSNYYDQCTVERASTTHAVAMALGLTPTWISWALINDIPLALECRRYERAIHAHLSTSAERLFGAEGGVWEAIGAALAVSKPRRDLISVSVRGDPALGPRIAAAILRGVMTRSAPRIFFLSIHNADDDERALAAQEALFLHGVLCPPCDAESPDEVLCAAMALAPRSGCYAALPDEGAKRVELHQLDTVRVSVGRVVREVCAS